MRIVPVTGLTSELVHNEEEDAELTLLEREYNIQHQSHLPGHYDTDEELLLLLSMSPDQYALMSEGSK